MLASSVNVRIDEWSEKRRSILLKRQKQKSNPPHKPKCTAEGHTICKLLENNIRGLALLGIKVSRYRTRRHTDIPLPKAVLVCYPHNSPKHLSYTFSRFCLFRHVRLRASLFRFGIIMPHTHLLLLFPVSRHPGQHPARRSLHPLLDPRTEVRELPLCFLPLAGGVLLGAFFFQGGGPGQVAEGLLGGADGLVPGA